jgi:hypothetical protein
MSSAEPAPYEITPPPPNRHPSSVRFAEDLLTGGPEDLQCPHGVPRGHWLRPSTGTPECAMCRRRWYRQRGGPPQSAPAVRRDQAAADYGHALLEQWRRDHPSHQDTS